MMTQAAMKKRNPKIRTPLDLLEYNPYVRLVVKILVNHEELEMTPLPLVISWMKIKMTKHVVLRVFTLTNTMETDLR